jgi:hypothetical protein
MNIITSNKNRPKGLLIGDQSYAENLDSINYCAQKYGYDHWRVRIMDAQRNTVNFINSVGLSKKDMDSATLLYQANGYSFSTASNGNLNNIDSTIVTPYTVKVSGGDNKFRKMKAELFYRDVPITDFDSFRLYDIMPAVSLWYFERRDYDGTPLHEKVFVNPVLGCTFRCKSCSRISFLNKPMEYMKNLDIIISQITDEINNRKDLKVVNISTGTFTDPDDDFDLFKTIILEFRINGYSDARFSIQTSTIFNENQLDELRALGVDRFSVTMDGTSDEVLSKIYKGKGPGTIQGYSEMVKHLETIFPKVAVHMILGHDSTDTIKRTSEIFAHQGKAAIHHYIPRVFQKSQHAILHKETFERGLEYYVDMKSFIDDLNDARMPKMNLLNPFYGLEADEFKEMAHNKALGE